MNIHCIPDYHKDTIVRLYKGGAVLKPQLTEFDIDILHAAVGIATEAGELMAAVLPAVMWRSEHTTVSTLSDVENIKEELGDHLFYEGALRVAAGLEYLGPPEAWASASTPDVADPSSPGFGMDRVLVRLVSLHAALAGDILDVVKRVVIYRKGFEDTPADGGPSLKERLRQHLLNDCWAVTRIASAMGVTEAELRDGNVMKLEKGSKARYRDGYSDAAAIARADKQEDPPTAGDVFPKGVTWMKKHYAEYRLMPTASAASGTRPGPWDSINHPRNRRPHRVPRRCRRGHFSAVAGLTEAGRFAVLRTVLVARPRTHASLRFAFAVASTPCAHLHL